MNLTISVSVINFSYLVKNSCLVNSFCLISVIFIPTKSSLSGQGKVQRSVRTIENFWCRRSGRAAKGWGFVLGFELLSSCGFRVQGFFHCSKP